MTGLGHCADIPNKLFHMQKVNSRWECEMENIKNLPNNFHDVMKLL